MNIYSVYEVKIKGIIIITIYIWKTGKKNIHVESSTGKSIGVHGNIGNL